MVLLNNCQHRCSIWKYIIKLRSFSFFILCKRRKFAKKNKNNSFVKMKWEISTRIFFEKTCYLYGRYQYLYKEPWTLKPLYLSLPEFTWVYLCLPKFPWIYLNLPKITLIYLNVPEFTRTYYVPFMLETWEIKTSQDGKKLPWTHQTN